MMSLPSAADHVLDALQHVPADAGALGIVLVEGDDHGLVGAAVVHDVIAAVAVEKVVAPTLDAAHEAVGVPLAVQVIAAVAAVQHVLAPPAIDPVVAIHAVQIRPVPFQPSIVSLPPYA